MTEKIKRFVLNWIYSLVTFGKQPHYIIAVFENESLAACKAMNLPCFNATDLAPGKIENIEHTGHGSQIQWTKIHVSYAILQRGYHLIASDTDVVWLRNVNKSYDSIFRDTHADGIFAPEEGGINDGSVERADLEPWVTGGKKEIYLNLLNSGVYAMRNTNRSLGLVKRWWTERDWDDQGWLNRHHGKAFVVCSTMMACLQLQRAGWMTIFMHTPFFEGDSCWQGPDWHSQGMRGIGHHEGAGEWSHKYGCDTRRLYIHFLCGCCWKLKSDSFESAKLWLIGEDLKPLWTGGSGNSSRLFPFLPCHKEVAWVYDSKHSFPVAQYNHMRQW